MDFVFNHTHGFIDERFMHNVLNGILNILDSCVEFDGCVALWQYIVGLTYLSMESMFYIDFVEVIYIYCLLVGYLGC